MIQDIPLDRGLGADWHTLGYKVENGRLVTVEPEAQQVGHIFERFLQIGSAAALVKELNAAGLRTKAWQVVRQVRAVQIVVQPDLCR